MARDASCGRPDMEKVIDGLETCLALEVSEDENPCMPCPYFFDEMCQSAIKKDAIALLREQEPVEPWHAAWSYLCGECKKPIHQRAYAYCPWCGKAVKWDGGS